MTLEDYDLFPEPDDRNLGPRKCRHDYIDQMDPRLHTVEFLESAREGPRSGVCGHFDGQGNCILPTHPDDLHEYLYPLGAKVCRNCNRVQNAEASRRGRTNRSRGNAIERVVGKELGLKRVGQFGGPTDLEGERFVVSVKSGSGYFSERYWKELHRQTANANQSPLLVVTDAPGPGHKRRAYVVIEFHNWVDEHGVPAVES